MTSSESAPPPSRGDRAMPRSTTPTLSPATAPAAGVWRRTMSAVYDGVILFGVLMFFGYAFSALAQFRGEAGTLRASFQGYLFLVLGAYFVGFWSNGRRTLPMKTMAITLVTDAGQPVEVWRAAWRYVVASAFFWGLLALIWRHSPWFALIWPLPYFWGLLDPKHRTWYDLAAGTRLVRTDAPAGQA